MNGDRQRYALFFFTFKPRDKNISDILHVSTPARNLLSFYICLTPPLTFEAKCPSFLMVFGPLVLWPLQVYY